MEFAYILLSTIVSGVVITQAWTTIQVNRSLAKDGAIAQYNQLAANAVFSTFQSATEFTQQTGNTPPFDELVKGAMEPFRRLIEDFGLPPLRPASAHSYLSSTAFRLLPPPEEDQPAQETA